MKRQSKIILFSLLIVIGLVLIALAYLPGPLGVPGYFTYVACPTNVPKGEIFSCHYVYGLDGLAILGGGIMAVVGSVGLIITAIRSYVVRSVARLSAKEVR
jgi:hypothetical protein